LREGQLNKLGAAIPSSNNNINFSNPVGSSNNLSPSGPIGNELLAEMTERIGLLIVILNFGFFILQSIEK
jgi:hypothetical protein